jgi:arsenate reductase
MSDDDAWAALAAAGRLIKRPFVALPSGDFLVGFKPVDWNQALLG